MRILVVEDDALVALDMANLLEDLGHEVVGEAHDRSEAFDFALTRHPDLALMDIRLARGDNGGHLARELYGRMGVRCLFISGSITEAFRTDMQDVRPVGFLSKPVSPLALQRALAPLA